MVNGPAGGISVAVGSGVKVSVGVNVSVGVSEGVKVRVGEGMAVNVGVFVRVSVGDGTAVKVGVSVGKSVRVAVGLSVAVAGISVGVRVSSGVGVADNKAIMICACAIKSSAAASLIFLPRCACASFVNAPNWLMVELIFPSASPFMAASILLNRLFLIFASICPFSA